MMLEFEEDEFEYGYDDLFDADDPDFIDFSERKHQKRASRRLSFPSYLEGDLIDDADCEGVHFYFDTSSYTASKMRQVEMTHSPKYSIESDLNLLDDLLTLHSTSDNITIEDLKSERSSCSTCGVSWNEEHVSLDCFECGGYSMERPCPICDGQCKQIWRRDITMSHSMRKAHWEGECGLPANEQQAYLLKNLIDVTEDNLSEAFEDLATSS